VCAAARLAATGRSTWWINGVEVGRGPVRTNPRRSVWDDADVTPLLRVGLNTVAVQTTHEPMASAWSMPFPSTTDLSLGAMAFELHLGECQVAGHVIGSNSEWRSSVLDGWSATPPRGVTSRGIETIDLRSLPAGWTTDSVSTDGWAKSIERRAFVFGASGRPNPPSFPVGPLAGRPISRPAVELVPLILSGGRFESPQVEVGALLVDVEGPSGAAIRVHTVERLATDIGSADTTSAHESGLTIVCDGTRRQVETVDVYGLRCATVDADDGVVVHGIAVLERLHPVTGNSRFECSDPLLNNIYAVGRRTVSICSLDSYVDCPTREQRAWTGDSVVHQLVDLTTNFDWSLAKWHPLLAASPRADGMLPMAVAGDIEANDMSIIPDWALHWVHSVWNLYRYVGDRDAITGLLPTAEGVLRWFLPFVDTHGTLVDVPGWVIIDWASVYSDGVSATLNGLWGRALQEFADMSRWIGDEARAKWADEHHARLRSGFEQLWDPTHERYADVIIDGIRQPMASQHGQAAALVGGLAPPNRWAQLVTVITDESKLIHATFSAAQGPADPGSETELGGMYLATGHPEPWWDVQSQVVRAQPFFRYVVHDALVAAGRADLISTQLLDWQWLVDRCPTSFSETWYGGTTSHGWSSTPTRDLIQRVLGLTPDVPGFSHARLEPALGHLTSLHATAPTPFGSITVSIANGEIDVASPIPVRLIWNGTETMIVPTLTGTMQ
jgi:alpha-L-rhamnosidase